MKYLDSYLADVSTDVPVPAYETYETPLGAGFVGFVGTPLGERERIEGVPELTAAERAVIDRICAGGGATAADLAPEPPLPPRPDDPAATWGYTTDGHVVELAERTEASERDDPLKLVTGEGWPTWYPATPEDRRTRPARMRRKTPQRGCGCDPDVSLAAPSPARSGA